MEQRNQDRMACDLPAQLQVNGVLLSGLIKNISCGGIFVQTPREIGSKSDVEVLLHLPNDKNPLKLSSELVWTGPPSQVHNYWGLGLKFHELLPEEEQRIQSFLERNNKEDVN